MGGPGDVSDMSRRLAQSIAIKDVASDAPDKDDATVAALAALADSLSAPPSTAAMGEKRERRTTPPRAPAAALP